MCVCLCLRLFRTDRFYKRQGSLHFHLPSIRIFLMFKCSLNTCTIIIYNVTIDFNFQSFLQH